MAKTLGVSTSTIRRDLQRLERQHLVTRVHGGAVALDYAASPRQLEAPRLQRAKEHVSEKRRIGRRAADLINDGQTVLLGGGTTTEGLLSFLKNRDLTVLTNNLHIAAMAARNEALVVVVLGGYLRRDEMSLLGHITTDPLTQLTIDKGIFGAYAIDRNGLMGADVAESQTDRTLVTAASELVVVADASKFARRGPIRLANASQISALITDLAAPPEPLAALRAQGVEVIQC
jgi:DeoR family transcriptional regulator, aga operon transcriptional repressor